MQLVGANMSQILYSSNGNKIFKKFGRMQIIGANLSQKLYSGTCSVEFIKLLTQIQEIKKKIIHFLIWKEVQYN